MGNRVAAFAAAIAWFATPEAVHAQDCASVVARFRRASVSLQVEGVNRSSGAVVRSAGSGVIVSDRGHVLTNKHVIQLGDEFIDVTVGGSVGSRVAPVAPMRIIDVDASQDLALLQFNNTGVTYEAASIGGTEAVRVGSSVCSFGYPLDVEFRPTSGTLGTASGPGGWWMLDVAMNPGESGSPVFTLSGSLIGLRVAGRQDAVGIYYMVPVHLAARLLAIVPKLPATRPLLDARVAQVQAAVRRALHFPRAAQTARSVPTMIQGMLVGTAPLRVYEILARYDDLDLRQLPEGGAALDEFFRRYYAFEQTTAELERDAVGLIGRMVQVRFLEGWRIYLRYAYLRFSGQTANQVSAGNNFLNFSITWEDAERVVTELARDPQTARRFASVFEQHQAFTKDIEKLKTLVPFDQ